ncbi:NAD(P)-binding protein [Schizophyllum commune Tattone D]|nr:NAD(P)-binding protein [Schizophyllum commune Tattone D]
MPDTPTLTPAKKLILVIGATGAQGTHVIDKLLEPYEDGRPSPYAIRALTRDPTHRRASDLEAKGVEIMEGPVEDLSIVARALKGCYGAFVNLDTYALGAEGEIHTAIRIYEETCRTPGFQHLVWSGLDYGSKLGNFDLKYACEQQDAKGIVTDFLRGQPSENPTWTALTSGVYMEMLNTPVCGPLHRTPDGTTVFALPLGSGSMPMIALADLAWWACYALDNPALSAGKELRVASDMVSGDRLTRAFAQISGQPAVYLPLSLDEWFACMERTDAPLVHGADALDGTNDTTIRGCFTGFWNLWHDGVVKKDMEWVRKVYPGTLSLEKWMKTTGYTASYKKDVLKNVEDGKGRIQVNRQRAREVIEAHLEKTRNSSRM